MEQPNTEIPDIVIHGLPVLSAMVNSSPQSKAKYLASVAPLGAFGTAVWTGAMCTMFASSAFHPSFESGNKYEFFGILGGLWCIANIVACVDRRLWYRRHPYVTF